MAVDLVLRKKVPVGKRGHIDVRGLSLEDLTGLLHAHLPSIIAAVDHYREAQSNVYAKQSLDTFLLTTATVFPALAAEIVSLATDGEYPADKVREAGAGLQIAALTAVAELTLEDMGDLSDPSPALGALMRQTLGAVVNRPPILSPVSTGESAVP